MRKFLLLSLLVLFSFIFSQNRYSAFGHNGVFGIVDKTNLTEFLAPSYQRVDFFFTDYLAMKKDSQVDFYSKSNAEKFSLIDQEQDEIKLNDRNYYHYQDANASYLIPDLVAEKIKLPKKYKSIIVYKDFLIGALENSFDIIDFKNQKVSKSIKAIYYHAGTFNNHLNSKTEDLIVFYGTAIIEVYDDQQKLLKAYKSNEKSKETVLKIISKDFEYVPTPEMVYRADVADPDWASESLQNRTKIWLSKDKRKYFSIAGRCEIHYADGKNWISIQSYSQQQTFQFEVDFENKIFIIPQKYIDILDLKFD